jgi:hypothetical protein
LPKGNTEQEILLHASSLAACKAGGFRVLMNIFLKKQTSKHEKQKSPGFFGAFCMVSINYGK